MGDGVKGTLDRLLALRPGDLSRVLPLAGSYALVLASLYVLKPARNALFLERIGVEQLPFALATVAVVGGVTAFALSRWASAVRFERFVAHAFVVLIAVLIAFRLLLPAGWTWLFYFFYAWVGLHGLIATSLIWLRANASFDARDARRVFGAIATGGIAGSILGGLLTDRIAERVGTENLLLVCAGFMAACVLLLRGAVDGAKPEPKSSAPSAAGSVFDSALVRELAALSLLISIVSVIVEIQFNEIVDARKPSQDEKTAFFGAFFAYLSIFALLFQVFVTPRILRALGAGAALFFLPLSLALGSGALLIAPGLIAGALLKIGDGGLRHSIHKSATEVVFLPVPNELKARAKLFLDTAIDTTGTGIGAALVAGLSWIGVAGRDLSLLSLVLIAATAYTCVRARRAYVAAFRRAIERRELDLGALRANLRDGSTARHLLSALDSEDEKQLAYVLDLLALGAPPGVVPAIARLLDHPSAEVRLRAVAALQGVEDRSIAAAIEGLLGDPDQRVRLAATRFLAASRGAAGSGWLSALIADEDVRVRTAAIASIADTSHPGAADDPIARAMRAGTAEDRTEILGAWLLERLGDRRHRESARRALVAMGSEIVPLLSRALDDARNEPIARRNIVRVLSEIPAQRSVGVLVEHLERAEAQIAEEILHALERLKTRHAELDFRDARIEAALEARTKAARGLARVERALNGAGPEDALLVKTVGEKRAQALDQIFCLLGLIHSPDEMRDVHRSLIAGNEAKRASAIELLDNILPVRTKRELMPLLDPPEPRSSEGEADRIETRTEALSWLTRSEDPWLRACAARAQPCATSDRGLDLGRPAMLSVIERVIFLQKVDVFSEVSSEQLGYLAAIAGERSYAAGEQIYAEHDASDSMYLVLEGRVRIHRGEAEVTNVGVGEAFGTWALFDDEPRVVAATAAEPCRVLRIGKEDFIELLADNVRITQAVLKAIARRLRGLASLSRTQAP